MYKLENLAPSTVARLKKIGVKRKKLKFFVEWLTWHSAKR
jgi:hypothetical protein